jgi:hypothetical protein
VSVQAVRVLDDEAGEDARERAKHGGSWNRPESATLAAPMRERLETYRQNLTQAEESDRSLAGRVGESADMFSHLHPDRIGMLLPPLQVSAMCARVRDSLRRQSRKRSATACRHAWKVGPSVTLGSGDDGACGVDVGAAGADVGGGRLAGAHHTGGAQGHAGQIGENQQRTFSTGPNHQADPPGDSICSIRTESAAPRL